MMAISRDQKASVEDCLGQDPSEPQLSLQHDISSHLSSGLAALFTLCAGNELFYCLLYLFSFSEGPLVGSVGLFRMGLWITAPISLLKSLISVIHLITAARNMAALDAADRAKKK
ncbi:CDP-diacylglycerol--inositol 3-phosphatidyltransferase [Pteropus alecto]|uniref:CDP-diacylglycerol--inositol 3-phosphatidyltransferase n=1 Tax=Pteropus alecto TaxID=9402 RepID=L5KI11_PTEAL|nr:CDP-diacylglycerol--inositol 3-phosphatidyltransferase [Pteropus alecto]